MLWNIYEEIFTQILTPFILAYIKFKKLILNDKINFLLYLYNIPQQNNNIKSIYNAPCTVTWHILHTIFWSFYFFFVGQTAHVPALPVNVSCCVGGMNRLIWFLRFLFSVFRVPDSKGPIEVLLM